MDGLTQGLLGATFAKAVASHKLGHKRAVWWGALAGMMPDLDILARIGGEWASLRHHRGVTHSLWFGPVVGTLLGYLVFRYYKRKRGEHDTLRWWIALFVLAIGTHPLLDVFTTYGTQLFAPFSDRRLAFNGVGIVDLFYSIPLLLALLVGRRPEQARRGRVAALVALALTTGYLLFGVWQNERAERFAAADLARRGLRGAEVRAYPTLFQLFLRRVVARDRETIRVGYVTTLALAPPRWRTKRRVRHPALTATLAHPRGRLFHWFAMGQTAARVLDGGRTVEVDDVRYGFPHASPGSGFWGVRARLDAAGKVRSIARFRRSMSGMWRAFVNLWRGAAGAPL